MKINRIIKITALAITIIAWFSSITTAQDQSLVNEKSEATIVLSYYKKADLSKTAVAIVNVRNKEGKFVFAKNVRVNFYLIHNKELQLLNSANTDNKGHAVMVLKKDLPLDEDLYFTIVAKIENDSLYENTEEQVRYKEAKLTLILNPKDTSQNAIAQVTEIEKDGKEIPVEGAEVKFFVQRLFGIMPAAEEYTVTTDENGKATFIYPKNIPGDTAGTITVVVKMEDNEQFGNLENKATTSWGTSLAKLKDAFPRALWEPYAPLPLVLTISILFGGVWTTYLFVFYQMRKIKNEGELTTNNTKPTT